jgi:citrate lyase beta subunit
MSGDDQWGNHAGTMRSTRWTDPSCALRAWLVTPGADPGRFDASINSGADVALLDLEDSVADADKDAARAAVLQILTRWDRCGGGRRTVSGVRLNALDTVHGLRDMVGLVDSGRWPGVLVVPKVEAARDVELVAQIVRTQTSRCEVWALIETPRAVRELTGILRSPGLAGVLFGAADYAAAAGCRLTPRALSHPRAVLAAAAAAARLPAIDSPSFDLLDLDGLRAEVEDAVEQGFAGKVAVHPRQLAVIRSALQPAAGDLDAAHAVVRAAEAAGGAVTTVGGRMVGPPVVAVARDLTSRSGTAGSPLTAEECRSD